jgi:hypothetical protein
VRPSLGYLTTCSKKGTKQQFDNRIHEHSREPSMRFCAKCKSLRQTSTLPKESAATFQPARRVRRRGVAETGGWHREMAAHQRLQVPRLFVVFVPARIDGHCYLGALARSDSSEQIAP